MSVPEAVLDALRGASRVCIATHSPMDGDGMGCGLALGRALTAEGKSHTFVTEAPVPRAYKFLPGHGDIVRLDQGADLPPFDLLVGLDAGEESRLGRAYCDRTPGVPVVNIDHHVSNPGYGDVVWVDREAAATGEQMYLLLRALGWELDPVAAQCLLVSLVTDTGRFIYSSTTARTLRIAAELVDAGADPDGLQRHLYGALPLAVMRLQARAVEELRFHGGGRVAILTVPQGFGRDLGVDEEEVKDLVDLAISVEGVVAAALVRGLANGQTKVSLRSKDDRANVSALAKAHGGGGHIRASGYTSPDGPEATEATLRPELEELAVAASG